MWLWSDPERTTLLTHHRWTKSMSIIQPAVRHQSVKKTGSSRRRTTTKNYDSARRRSPTQLRPDGDKVFNNGSSVKAPREETARDDAARSQLQR